MTTQTLICVAACRAPVSNTADVQVAVLRQRCVLLHTADVDDTAVAAVSLAPRLLVVHCCLPRCHPSLAVVAAAAAASPVKYFSCSTAQTAAMQRQTAASPAAVSCASHWKATYLCAISHTRCVFVSVCVYLYAESAWQLLVFTQQVSRKQGLRGSATTSIRHDRGGNASETSPTTESPTCC